MFLMNAWYVACTPDEIADRPLGRRICDLPMVFYRPAPDAVAALEDFCPHRGAPLSLGRVCDGRLVCGYHGMAMGCEGRAVSMPGQRVAAFPAIRAYPVVERHGFIWVWPGDAAQADPARIPDLPWHGNPAWAHGGGMYAIRADARLMIDNLMDLTHETYVHATSIGQPEIDETPARSSVQGDEVVTRRHMEGITAPPFWQAALRASGLADDVPVDRWQICRFRPPGQILIEVGVAHAGLGGIDAPDDRKVYALVTDFITPETASSMWYFWGMARTFRPDDAELTARIREGQGRIFSEDLEILERQQRNLDAFPGRELLRLNIDAGGVLSRRVLDRLIAQERAAAAP